MLPINFKQFFLENILDFLWRQWSALGVAGGAYPEDRWIIDPEAILVFSLEIARYEPRLFDEILDWLVVNGKWIDIQRLRSIIKNKEDTTQRLVSAVAYFLSREIKTYQRKWRALSLHNKLSSNLPIEMLFKTKEGKPYPKPKEASVVFHDYGFLREEFFLRRMSKSTPTNIRSNIRFLLRKFFGIGSRAECIVYLLTHEAGHPSEVAKAIGISVRATQDALIELAESGLVLTRIKGKRKIEYWLPQKRWWEFLSGMNYEDTKNPIWLDWISLYSALIEVWDLLKETEKTESDYMRSSKLREAMKTISHKFSESKMAVPAVPDRNVSSENYEQAFHDFIIKVLGASGGTGR
jgi:DNA-binding transcriptional regulator GbsR (MarR family)